MDEAKTTYRVLIQPIPPSSNIFSVSLESEPAGTPCAHCTKLQPARHLIKIGLIKTSYSRIITYPQFPELKESARDGCNFCRLLRRTIRARWSDRPMEESGVGVLNEKEGWWDDLFVAPWDCKILVNDASFVAASTMGGHEDNGQKSYVITRLRLEIGPANLPPGDNGEDSYSKIGKTITFKVFDSIGECSYVKLWVARLKTKFLVEKICRLAARLCTDACQISRPCPQET
jgi:hypothetical protein